MLKKIILMMCLVFGCSAAVLADSDAQIKERMKQRLTKVNEYKDKGVLGESKTGYLQTRADDAAAAKVATEENADRKTVYGEIAKKTGATADQVGQKRAEQIAKNSKKGHWLQDSAGKWYQKN